MHAAWHWIGGALAFLAVIAAWSRIAKMEQGPTYIKNGFEAFAKLFNGAFGY